MHRVTLESLHSSLIECAYMITGLLVDGVLRRLLAPRGGIRYSGCYK